MLKRVWVEDIRIVIFGSDETISLQAWRSGNGTEFGVRPKRRPFGIHDTHWATRTSVI